MKLEKAEEKTTCVPVKNLKDLPHEKKKRQGERAKNRADNCELECLCKEVCLWVIGNVGELNILVVILP